MSKVIPIEERAAAELKARTLRSAPTNLSAHITLPVPVVESLVPRGEVTLVGGHGGAGKSVLGLILAAHVAAGKTWAGLTCTQGRVLIASLEDDANLVNYRLSRIADAYALDRDVIEDNITIVDGSDTDAALVSEMSEYGTARIIDMAPMEELREDADGCVLIVVDNASDAFDGNENNRRQVRGFMRRLKQVARENDAGLILLAHIDKNAARYGAAGNSYSGSTAWHNSARSRLALSLSEIGTVELHQEKRQLGKLADPIRLRWTDNGVLYPLEPTETSAAERDDEAAVMAALRAAWTAGVDVGTARVGATTAQMTLATFPELPDCLRGAKGREAFWIALGNLIASGKVVRGETTTRYRNRKEVFLEPGRCGEFVESNSEIHRNSQQFPASSVRCKEAQGCGDSPQRIEPAALNSPHSIRTSSDGEVVEL